MIVCQRVNNTLPIEKKTNMKQLPESHAFQKKRLVSNSNSFQVLRCVFVGEFFVDWDCMAFITVKNPPFGENMFGICLFQASYISKSKYTP